MKKPSKSRAFSGKSLHPLDLLFLVYGGFFAPLAVFFKLKFALYFFSVFAREIVITLAFGAVEFSQKVLGHKSQYKVKS